MWSVCDGDSSSAIFIGECCGFYTQQSWVDGGGRTCASPALSAADEERKRMMKTMCRQSQVRRSAVQMSADDRVETFQTVELRLGSCRILVQQIQTQVVVLVLQ